MRGIARGLTVLTLFVLMPATAYAQASLAGVARDTSGAVLPGVTVEAASPVLIEKVRTATTDSTGRFAIPDLRPGSYRVTFSLPGFRTVARENVLLSGSAVVTLNADMTIGGVEETITVSGETPLVDVQSTTRQTVLDREVVSAIPSSRNPYSVGTLIPGVNRAFGGPDVGGAQVQGVAALSSNNSRTADQRLMVNGVALSTMIAGGWGGGAVPNATGTAEWAIDSSAVDATAATGGVRVNFIPRTGGNSFSGTIFGSFATEGFASDNFDDDLRARGLSVPGNIKKNGDFNPGVGGPIVRDKLWFFASGRYLVAENYVAGMFHNANANRLDRFDYVASDRQAVAPQYQTIYQARFDWQASQRNRIGVTIDNESFCFCPTGVSATVAPDGADDSRFPVQRFVQLDWNSPVSNRLLLEASGIHRVERWGNMHLQTGKGGNIESYTPGIVSITDTGRNLTYRADPEHNNSWNWNIHYRAAMSYITGSHVFKIGFNNAYGHHENTVYTDPVAPYSFTFLNGVPSQITIRARPDTVRINVDRDLGVFAQDKWTVGRWTLSGGIRYDSFKNSFPPQDLGPTVFTPTRSVQFDRIQNLNWHDITPKMGATYDVFGTGRTALRVSLNKYLLGYGTTGFGENAAASAPNPINRLVTTASRPWNDRGGLGVNGDFVPQCNLLNFQPNGECGLMTNAATFGTIVPGTTYDPELLEGWGKRNFNWEFTAAVQHELVPRMALDVGYARRWYGNFQAMDDRSVGPGDYDTFTFSAPSDSRLPGGGGYTVTAVDLKPAANLTSQNNFVTLAKNFGKQTEHYDGIHLSVNARLQNGLVAQGGFGTGRIVTNDCDVVAALPETLHQFFGANTRTFVFTARPLELCDQDHGWRTSVQGLLTYTIPRVDVLVSGTYQGRPGGGGLTGGLSVVAANYNSFDRGTLGRPFSSGPFRSFNLVDPGELYIERWDLVDVRLSKIFRFGTTRTNINFDFYNVLNDNSVLTENFTFGPAWRRPNSILQARFFKISAQFDF